MDYSHPLLRELGVTDKKVTIMCKGLDDDLLERIETARQGDDPELLAQEIESVTKVQVLRWRDAN